MINFGSLASSNNIPTMLLIVLLGQQFTGVLRGHITQDSHPLVGATISLFRLNQQASGYNETIVSKTDGTGAYRLRLPSGLYVLLVSNGGRRLYQGEISIGQQDNVKDIALSSDPFIGSWKLDRADSYLPGVYGQITEEVRSYSQKDSNVEVSYKQTLSAGSTREETYEIRCDGTPIKHGTETTTCLQTAPNTIEGEQWPPTIFFVHEVIGDRLTLTGFSEAAHQSMIFKEVFSRTSP
jgi:hypothetical protein